MLVDTDVLIRYMRGSSPAAALLAEAPSFAISAVTSMELVQGMPNQ